MLSRLHVLLFSFALASPVAVFGAGAPVLISHSDSTRAVALESPRFRAEPIAVTRETRLILFATFPFSPENGVVTCMAQDADDHNHNLDVEKVTRVQGVATLWEIHLKFRDQIQLQGDMLFQVWLDGIPSNRVRVGIGMIGGGPADDARANPTPFKAHACDPTQIVFDGDSLTRGQGASVGLDDYPAQVIQTLDCGYAYHNFGVDGQTLVDMQQDAGSQIDSLINHNSRNILIVWGGTNEFSAVWNFSAEQAYAHLVTYCTARHAAGWKVIVLTMLPRSDDFISHNVEPERAAFNALIRRHWQEYAVGLADVGADPTIGQFGAQLDSHFFGLDRVHLVPAGYGIVADYVKTQINFLTPPGDDVF